jgi:hypothetical protein
VKDFTLGLAASPWIVALLILSAFAFAVYSYKRTEPPARPLKRWTLIMLRTIGVALLLVAIFEPILSTLVVTAEEPWVVVAVDNSESMTLPGLDSVRIAETRRIVAEIQASPLGERSRVVLFSDSARPLLPPIPYSRFDARGTESRMDAPLALTADSLRNRNIRAVVMLSDGRYNAGTNPIFEAEKLGIPVYAVGVGDSVEPKDLSTQEIFTNEITYVNTELPVEVRVKSSGYDGGMATVTLRDDNGVVSSQQVMLAPGTNEYTTSFVYRPRSEGIAKLQATIAGAGGELTTKNNSRTAFVRVRSNKRSYVMIAGGPNPDVAFLRRVLSRDPNVQVRTFIQKSGSEFLEGKLDAGSFRDAEAVILVGYPTAGSSEEALSTIRSTVTRANLPLMVVLGPNVDINRLKSLESLLPVTFGVGRGGEMMVQPEITEAGRTSPATQITDMNAWDRLPPIYRSETSVHARPESEVLAGARIGATRLGEPLIVSRRLGASRSLIILGHGIYRWELVGEGVREARGEEGGDLLNQFVGNSLRWIATREQERRVRIASSKQLYALGEPVRIFAQVYGETYEPISDAVVDVTVEGGGRRYALTLPPSGSGRYEGALANLAPGDYTFNGRATRGGRAIGTDGGRFTVGEVGIEFREPSMNAELMRALASRTGGRFYTTRNAGTLAADIAASKGFAPRSIESRRDFALWNYPWVLAAALLAFVTEWIIRKRSGMM